jgi:hypothetical protein
MTTTVASGRAGSCLQTEGAQRSFNDRDGFDRICWNPSTLVDGVDDGPRLLVISNVQIGNSFCISESE